MTVTTSTLKCDRCGSDLGPVPTSTEAAPALAVTVEARRTPRDEVTFTDLCDRCVGRVEDLIALLAGRQLPTRERRKKAPRIGATPDGKAGAQGAAGKGHGGAP